MLRTLGVGGMGEVFLAERADAEFEQQVAIKVVYGGSLARGVQSRLKIERQILAQLDHPYIVRVYDQRRLPERQLRLLYMQYVAGGTLDIVAKDVDLACQLARDVGAPAALGVLASDLYKRAQALGWGQEGFPVVARLLEAMAGIELRPEKRR